MSAASDDKKHYVPVVTNEKMEKTLSEWMKNAMRRKNLNQSQLAKISGVDQSVISKILNGKRPRPSIETTDALVKSLGADENAKLILGMLYGDLWLSADGIEYVGHEVGTPMVGYVGAGEKYYPDPTSGDWHAVEHVETPPGARTTTVAVKVRGDSMEPRFYDGDLLYFSRASIPVDKCVNRDCVVQITGGPTLVKRFVIRNGKMTLISYDPNIEPIESPNIDWLAPIEWIKPSE